MTLLKSRYLQGYRKQPLAKRQRKLTLSRSPDLDPHHAQSLVWVRNAWHLQRPAFNLIHPVSPMSREREARQGIGDSSLRRGALQRFGINLKHPTSLFAFDRRERQRTSDSGISRSALGRNCLARPTDLIQKTRRQASELRGILQLCCRRCPAVRLLRPLWSAPARSGSRRRPHQVVPWSAERAGARRRPASAWRGSGAVPAGRG